MRRRRVILVTVFDSQSCKKAEGHIEHFVTQAHTQDMGLVGVVDFLGVLFLTLVGV